MDERRPRATNIARASLSSLRTTSTTPPEPGSTKGPLQRLLAGTNVKVVCTLPGTSQYTQGAGGSSCGLACMNAVRVVYTFEQLRGIQLLERLDSPQTIVDCLSICKYWTGAAHLEVDDIRKLPLFEATLSCAWMRYGAPTIEGMRKLLSSLVEESQRRDFACVAAVLTRPPEMVAVFCVPTGNEARPHLFAVFDSHPRPLHADGAAFIFFRDITAAGGYLADLLKVDPALYDVDDGTLQWQAQLLSQFSAHCFTQRKDHVELMDHTYDTNMRLMDRQLRMSDAEDQMRRVLKETERLKRQLDEEREHRKALQLELEKRTTSTPTSNRSGYSVWGWGTSDRANESSRSSVGSRTTTLTLTPPKGSSSASLYPDGTIPGSYETQRPSRSNVNVDVGSTRSRDSRKSDIDYGHMSSGRGTNSSKTRSNVTMEDDFDLAARLQVVENEQSLRAARRLQDELNSEDARLKREHDMLMAQTQKTFECAICMEILPEDSVARVDGCSHELCRSCMRQYIINILQERKFPIPCPLCKAGIDTDGSSLKHSVIALSPHLVDTIGLTEEQNMIWNELQIVGLSIELECRQCRQKMHVDREDYDATEHIACPMPNCTYVWCKKCNQEIPMGPVDHSCDGTNELDHLMKDTGWKYCPGCKTPCEKIAGCNHMTCTSPGCNTHFCYKCGAMIVKSDSKLEIGAGVTAHYLSCALFEYPGV